MTRIKQELEGELGYATISLLGDELSELRNLIRSQWLNRIRAIAPGHSDEFDDLPMSRYHEYANLIDHKYAWPKLNRILPPKAVIQIRNLPFIRHLEEEFGSFVVSDEENLGWENMYWRLVRPDSESDVGPMHADKWFWDLGHGVTPPDVKRVKVWIAIFCEKGRAGFRLVPGSHRKEWPHHGEYRDGFTKPQIDVPDDQLDISMFDSAPGDAIIFNDQLLHGGAVGGALSRVSLEFTLFVNKDRYFY